MRVSKDRIPGPAKLTREADHVGPQDRGGRLPVQWTLRCGRSSLYCSRPCLSAPVVRQPGRLPPQKKSGGRYRQLLGGASLRVWAGHGLRDAGSHQGGFFPSALSLVPSPLVQTAGSERPVRPSSRPRAPPRPRPLTRGAAGASRGWRGALRLKEPRFGWPANRYQMFMCRSPENQHVLSRHLDY